MRGYLNNLSRVLLCTIAVSASMLVAAASAFAIPAFKVYPIAPDSIYAGEEPWLTVAVQNVGNAATSGPVTITDTLSPGLTFVKTLAQTSQGLSELASCKESGQSLTCVLQAPMQPGVQLEINVKTTIDPKAEGTLTGDVTVSGGGSVEPVHSQQRMAIDPPGPFGFTLGEVQLMNADGSEALQAASVPAEYTTTLVWRSFASRYNGGAFSAEEYPSTASVEHFKDVTAHLPPGMIGNPTATPVLCTPDELGGECPVESQVGIAHVYLNFGHAVYSKFTPLYNMVAPRGVATELGFDFYGTNVLLQAHIRPTDYGIDVVSVDTTTSAPVIRVDITAWGVPAEHSHDPYRGTCLELGGHYDGSYGTSCPTTEPAKAFLRMPTGCSGQPLPFGADTNSYEHPDKYVGVSFNGPTLNGCDAVPFNPSLYVDPTGTAANSPTGVNVKMSVPQNKAPEGLGAADVKKVIVTLPEGMAINPSAADGLQVCDDAHLHLGQTTPAACPEASKIGTLLLHTQLISNPLEGTIYLRPQNSQDPTSGEMFRIVMEIRDDEHGLDLKVPGQIVANPVTGRLTTTFDNLPEFPFEDITLKFKAGARAPLTTPFSCQTQTTGILLYPYSAPERAVYRSSSFSLTSGPEETPCTSHHGFNPVLSAGVSSVQAGAFTPFITTFSRKDADQSMQRVSVKLPQGLLGSLIGLPLCPEAQANAGTCNPASLIGTFTAGAGSGPNPLYVTDGKVYMTGPYKGAPFGLSIAVPAKAGPFDLGTVVVRAKVEVDIHTSQLTVTTDQLPQVVSGVPVNLRLVNVTIDRPNFTYNPTDCNPATVTGTMTGGEGAVATLTNHFQVTNCGALKFQPHFTVSASGKTSRASGASLDAKLTYPKTPQGTESNIARVKVDLPRQLPSRLTTLQKACTAATFEANPAACPAPSRIGTATATTPVLPVPLSGPVYFVSHGGEAFPDLVIVLQGYGVTVDLVGTTFISKAGITSTTFKTVPDVPVGAFELKLPQGRFSALAANGDLCKSKLAMPTAFIAQDGAEIHESTPITATGCARHKATTSRHKAKHHNKKGKRK
jgi:uncharacterized repeat protein (TIGR01451 family)